MRVMEMNCRATIFFIFCHQVLECLLKHNYGSKCIVTTPTGFSTLFRNLLSNEHQTFPQRGIIF